MGVSATTHAAGQEDAGFGVVRTCRHDQKSARGRPWRNFVSLPLSRRVWPTTQVVCDLMVKAMIKR